MSEIIPNETAAKILRMSRQEMFRNMLDGKLDIGWVKPRKKRTGKATYRVYRAKLAKHLGREPDHVWDEEVM